MKGSLGTCVCAVDHGVDQGVIEKSPADTRSYRAVTLANGLRVLLVSDPGKERTTHRTWRGRLGARVADRQACCCCRCWVDAETERAAAAMDVHVGHFSDPDDLPGLAQ